MTKKQQIFKLFTQRSAFALALGCQVLGFAAPIHSDSAVPAVASVRTFAVETVTTSTPSDVVVGTDSTAAVAPLPECYPCPQQPPAAVNVAAAVAPLPECYPCPQQPPAAVDVAAAVAPLPECYPCPQKPPAAVNVAAAVAPLPECYPCPQKPPAAVNVAAAVAPLPECYPCPQKPPAVAEVAAAVAPLPECYPCPQKPPTAFEATMVARLDHPAEPNVAEPKVGRGVRVAPAVEPDATQIEFFEIA